MAVKSEVTLPFFFNQLRYHLHSLKCTDFKHTV